jgi:hypothetical protein
MTVVFGAENDTDTVLVKPVRPDEVAVVVNLGGTSVNEVPAEVVLNLFCRHDSRCAGGRQSVPRELVPTIFVGYLVDEGNIITEVLARGVAAVGVDRRASLDHPEIQYIT